MRSRPARTTSKDTKVPLRIDFSDDVAGPFPANFLCFQVGGGPQSLCDKNTGAIYGHNPACSVPGSPGKSTTFSCTADYGQVPDGNVWACVIAADASIPDNPNGPDQSATAEKANLSAASCDGVVRRPHAAHRRDRRRLRLGQGRRARVGQASASDATSGLAGAGQWTWGDNTGGASGDAVTHTYTQAGTDELALTVTDAAGNAATAKKAITVAAAGGGGDDHAAPDRRRDDHAAPDRRRRRRPRRPPAAADDDAARRRRRPAPTRPRRSSSTPRAALAPAPSRSRWSSRRTTRAGSSSRSRAARARSPAPASGSTPTAPPTTASSSRRASSPGRYTLKATYAVDHRVAEPDAQRQAVRPARERRARSAGVAVGAGPRALPDGRFHGPRPERTFRFAR